MKKFIIIPAILLSLLISGCDSGKQTTMTCTATTSDKINGYDVASEYKVIAIDGKVDKVISKEKVTSKSSEMLDAFEKQLDETYKKVNDNYGGYTYNIKRGTNEVTSDVEIDYNKMNLDLFVKDQPILKQYLKDGKLSVDGLRKIYEQIGATCK